MPRPVALLVALALGLPASAHAQIVSKQVGRVTVMADHSLAFPGGLFVVYLQSTRRLGGTMYAILDGRRCPFFPARTGLRALVPIPSTLAPGSNTLGIEIRGGRGRQRIPMQVLIASRQYPQRMVVLPEAKKGLVVLPAAIRGGRQLQLLLRTISPFRQWRGPFRSPVGAEPVYSYGAPTSYLGASPVETHTDSVYGEYHRGMDYLVPPGTVVQAPAPGVVLMAAHLPLTGQTLVLDHGQGVLSVFFHLSRIEAREGDWVEGRAPLALSGESGLAAVPHLHWAVYVLGVAVDPRVMERLTD